MKILAIEWSSGERSVAYREAMAEPSGRVVSFEKIEKEDRSGRGVGLIEAVLLEAGIEPRQVECLVVGLGPGSYTGVRSAIASVQGWSLVRDIRVLGISSAEAIATQAKAQGILGRVRVVLDAQRQEFYTASYEITPQGVLEREPLRLASRSQLESSMSPEEQVIGPDLSHVLPSIRSIYPRAAMLAELATRRKDWMMADALTPIYLREVSFVKAPPPRVV